MRNPLTQAQKSVVKADLARAIGQICDAWPDAVLAVNARCYPSGSANGSRSIGGHADPTLMSSLTPDKPSIWLNKARRELVALLRMSASDEALVGTFSPPRLRQSLISAGTDAVDIWPQGFGRTQQSIYDLANEAIRSWPPTPRKGTTIRTPDGDVIVGQKSSSIETCAGCNESVFGGAADPIVRIDGKPYHKSPCYLRAYRKLTKKVPA